MNFKYKYMSGRILLTGFVMALCILIFSCEDQNYLHDKYLEQGETIYLGIVDTVVAHPGDHRIKFEWMLSTDPRSTKTVIYWKDRDTSVVVPIEGASSQGERWSEVIISDLSENDYIFEFEMQDDNGNISKSIEVAGSVFGDLYVENIRKRGITSISKLLTKQLKISWSLVASAELQYSVVEYTASNGETVSLKVSNDEIETLVEGLNTGETFYVYSVYMPVNGLDTFPTKKEAYSVPKFEHEIDKAGFSTAFKPGDNTSYSNDRSLDKIWDGGTRNSTNGMTILHTLDYSSATGSGILFKFPHKFTFDIGHLADLYRFKIWGRVDNTAFTGHSPRFIEVWGVDELKTQDDFATEAEFEDYYNTTYVVQKNPLDYLSKSDASYVDIFSNTNSNSANFVETAPETGKQNWQADWHKLGDFEIEKPSGYAYGSKNDADVSAWEEGFAFNLNEISEKVRYIRILVKYPNWQNTNCINLGEVTFYGDDL